METRAALGSMGLFLSLATLPGCTLIIEELFFFGSRLCLTLLPPQGFPTRGNTAVHFLLRPDVAQWIFMLIRRMLKSILNFFRGSLTHVDGTSYAASSLQGFSWRLVNNLVVLFLRAPGGFACYKQELGLSKINHGLDDVVLGFLPQHLTLLRLLLGVDMLFERLRLSVCSFRLIY